MSQFNEINEYAKKSDKKYVQELLDVHFKKWVEGIRMIEPEYFKWKTYIDMSSGKGLVCEYLRELGAHCVGYDAREEFVALANMESLGSRFEMRDIAEKFPEYKSESIDGVVDIFANTYLYQIERENYIDEIARILKPGGDLFMIGYCLDGDRNARNMVNDEIQRGPEEYSYINTESMLVEYTFPEKNIRSILESCFEIQDLKKRTIHETIGTVKMKRRHFILNAKKK